jgi:hypothetical protein
MIQTRGITVAVKNFRGASAISFRDETSRRKEAPDVPHESSAEMG